MELSDFNISFRRDPIFGFWSWSAEGASVKLSGPIMGPCISKEGAEKDCLRRLRLYCDRYSLDGAALAARHTT